jgi:hypothetical protein
MIPIAIEEKVKNLKDIDSIFKLFEFLGYKEHLFDKSYKRNKTDFNLPKDILPNIENVYSVFNIEKHLFCFAIETKNISRPFLKAVSKSLLDSYIRVLLIFTDDWQTYYFTLPQYEKYEGKKRLKLSTLIVDTKQIYHTDLEVVSTLNITQEETYRGIWRNCWQQAFNKERVNDQFFKDFEKIFFELRTLVFNQIKDVKLSHEFAQQTLNRLIFLYFIAKKEWLASDKKFISNFYKEYKIERNKGNVSKDSFYENWLKILFFEVFNKSFPNLGIARYIPAEFKNNLIMFPYLNGGLFNEEDFDKVGVNIPDSTFNKIFAFLDKYNFTIKEDLPLDIEVAVDPQMLGYLYESFANIAEEIYERNDLGVFYTPVSEVDFMVRRSLVEYFANHLQKIPKDLIYKFVFDEDKKEAIEYINKHNLWENLEFLTEDVKIVDPACGSGAFLLGCLKALVELTQITNRHLGRERKDFDVKKDIIGKNFFGVDVMKWALHCAELRLWLSMIVEADLPEERRKEPLLPNFNLRLRVGDSLVQKIGDINLNLKSLSISREVKRKLNYLKTEKQKFYSNDPSRKFKDCESIKNEETRIFREILKEEIINKNKEIQVLNNQLYRINQLNIFGETSKDKINKKNLKNEIEFLEEKRELLEKACEELKPKGKQFVIWEIDFADVFEEKGGFDVVIGNPPYIRQEKISPPFSPKREVELKDKIKYKEELIDSIKMKYPFIKKLGKKCDYYIYFYLHGLSLLNPKGTFCFITSNSWLDVGYGRILQEFLVKYVPIKSIYDNQAKRSFVHALINTVIVFFGAPLIKNSKNPNPTCLDNVAKFIMLKKPYEEVISTQNLITIDNFITDTQSLFGNTLKTDQFKVYAIKQRDLLEEGIEIRQNKNEMFEDKLSGEYNVSKWGGKYLRAPDIYFEILEKGKGKLVRLGNISEVRRGITTGGNEFFFIEDVTDKINISQIKPRIKNIGDFGNIEKMKEMNLRVVYNREEDAYWLIEEEFLKPAIKSPRECKSIIVKVKDLKYKIFMCNKSKRELKGTKAIEYIVWGEKQKYNKRPTCASRKYWWNLGERNKAIINCNYMINEIIRFYFGKYYVSDDFQSIYSSKYEKSLNLILNSTLIFTFLNILGRSNFGGGLLKIQTSEIANLLILNPKIFHNYANDINIDKLFLSIGNRDIKSIFQELGFDPIKPIREQKPNPLPDRKALDDIVFDALELSEEERREIYWATAELVKNRLDKARSVKKK